MGGDCAPSQSVVATSESAPDLPYLQPQRTQAPGFQVRQFRQWSGEKTPEHDLVHSEFAK
jgi:hypothetical protein